MNKESIKRASIIFLALYLICITAVYFIGGDKFRYRKDPASIVSVESSAPVGEIIQGFTVSQRFVSETDNITKFTIKLATYNRINHGELVVQLLDGTTGDKVFETRIDIASASDNSVIAIPIPGKLTDTDGMTYVLRLLSDGTDRTNAVTVYYNAATTSLGRQLFFNETPVDGELCFSVTGTKSLLFGQYYFFIMGIIGLIMAAYCLNLYRCAKRNTRSWGLAFISAFFKYKFLLNQLVNRDFKTKYKRSVLGVLWSFLNPLLTMLVQYIVFSTIFKSSIINFPVYLLTGIICFNFFSEATGMSLGSIVGNASLITKVYIPKYIFPISRVLSSTINFLLSLIPLMLVILLTRTPLSVSFLLLPFVFACLIVFCVGMGMLMSSAMVFFRDTQFLWNVISMLWMYATPIFYPESIIPARFLILYKMNPMYHFIRFGRIVILQGESPAPMDFGICLFFSISILFLGMIVFKKTQDKFVLYI